VCIESIERARGEVEETTEARPGQFQTQPRLVDETSTRREAKREQNIPSSIPTISLNPKELKTAWKVEKTEDGKFVVTGEKIEKFARRTDLNNYASVNRLRDIMKKLGIRGELTTMGAEPDSIISIAGKEFTLVEDY
jgi:GTP-binding protein